MLKMKDKITNALTHPFLRGALNRFVRDYLTVRANALSGLDFESLRSEIGAIKDSAIDQLPVLIDSFTQQAHKNGARVYQAQTGSDAINYIVQLVHRKNIKRIVKSKSMTSEEIGLNHALLKAGAEVTETDLGEWIIQLAQQKPSHMVMPAIHLTAAEVAQLFTKVTGQHQSDNITDLVKIARRELRKRFLEADLGIIGANIAIADNGTLVVLTNEGNGRLVCTFPKIVIALVGIEKLVPSFKEAAPIIKILPRNATGQLATSYVSLIRRPSPEQEFHIVLLDNGRMKLRRSASYRTALRCLRCGACANVCPVYQQVGGNVFGHIYTGAIGLVLTRVYHGLKPASDLIPLCYKCQTCKIYCPAGIDIPQINIKLHHDLVRKQGQPLLEKIVFKGVLAQRPVFHSAVNIAQRAQSILLPKKRQIDHLPGPLAKQTQSKTLPLLAPYLLRNKISSLIKELPKPVYRVIFYPGCLIDFVYPSIGESVVKILQACNVGVIFSPEQTCCGLPAEFNGDRATALRLARANLKTFDSVEFDYIITACPTCMVALKNLYPDFFISDSRMHKLTQKISLVTYDISSFIVDILKADKLIKPVIPPRVKIAYHNACHLRKHPDIWQPPRQLLTQQVGYDLVELSEQDRCCGFGGSFSVKYPQISGAILDNKIDSIKKTKASIVATDCPGCILQIQGGLNRKKLDIRVYHTATLIAQNLSCK